ncbi:hypothetical protein LN245_003839 [Salmonella enterica subsp. enterica serovar Durham]|nr:hypothetical protein [Salmonella enterica subsp. enterica serovar Durham]EIN2616720.1 hypothetical protein [Salmonella enterica subsp. enterica serovar Durham]
MLQFIVVFFGTLVSVVTVNTFDHIGSQVSLISNANANAKAYVNILFQRQLFSYSFCRYAGQKCDADTLSIPRLYLPLPLAQGPVQQQLYTCYQELNNNGFVLLTGFEHDFLESKVGLLKAWQIVNAMMDSIATDVPLTVYTSRNKLMANDWKKINACVNEHVTVNDSFFLVSKYTGE